MVRWKKAKLKLQIKQKHKWQYPSVHYSYRSATCMPKMAHFLLVIYVSVSIAPRER